MLNLLYGAPGKLTFVSRGQAVESFEYTRGALQGCPLGLHALCLSLWPLMQDLDRMASRCNSGLVWIADDMTMVVPRSHLQTMTSWISEQFPRYGMRISVGKLYAYLPTPNEIAATHLRDAGFRVSTQGLHRLLGAPVGKRSFQIKSAYDGGHLALLTNDAIKFIRKTSLIQHVQARYHLLRWSAANLLLHLGRLIQPSTLSAYSMQFSQAMGEAVNYLLATNTLINLKLLRNKLVFKFYNYYYH